MTPNHENRRTRGAALRAAVILIAVILLLLVIGFFVIPDNDEADGIDMREDVDAVVDEAPTG